MENGCICISVQWHLELFALSSVDIYYTSKIIFIRKHWTVLYVLLYVWERLITTAHVPQISLEEKLYFLFHHKLLTDVIDAFNSLLFTFVRQSFYSFEPNFHLLVLMCDITVSVQFFFVRNRVL